MVFSENFCWNGTPMLTIEERIEIQRPPEAVYEFVADYRNAQKFLVAFDRFEAVDAPTASLGGRIRASGRVLGVRVDSVFEVIELERGKLIRTRSIQGPAGESSWRFEPRGSGTKVTLSMGLDSGVGLGGVIQRMVTDTIRGTIRESLVRLGKQFD